MYSGSTLTRFSGRMLGAHQKIDRIARKHLSLIAPKSQFPSIKNILHFEGMNGPDAIKRKSPAKDEPWHYYNPFDDSDNQLLQLIEAHFNELVLSIQKSNTERISFEAAWLAHALVDGLTPAHHYPYEEKLTELRGGLGRETRTTIKTKWIIPGETRSKKLSNNWKMWGAKGLFMTHGLFEMGVATLIKPLTFSEVVPNKQLLIKVEHLGLPEYFKQTAREIAVLGMYETYYNKGWTPKLAYDVRHKLGPALVNTVSLAWYLSLVRANKIPEVA
ncbi:MAG: hypothetical protein NVSMB46_06920 [Candidatus Saccharimonadales bacterium]